MPTATLLSLDSGTLYVWFMHLLYCILVLMQTYVMAFRCGMCRYPHLSVALPGLSTFANVEAQKTFSPQKPQGIINVTSNQSSKQQSGNLLTNILHKHNN